MHATLENIKESLLSQMSSSNEKIRNHAIKFVECVILTHSELTRDDPNMVKTSAKNKRMDNDGADTFHLRYVPTNHALLKKEEMRIEGRSRLEELVRRCCQTTGARLKLIKKVGFGYGNDGNDDDDDDEDDDEAPQVEYDVKFSQKNMFVSMNSVSGIGAHRAKLVDLIYPGMLCIHDGCYNKSASSSSSSSSSPSSSSSSVNLEDCVWSVKEAKSILNMNKNNMLKLLKYTSSVPWHEELVAALEECGAKEKALKAQEMSQEAAVSVSGNKRTLGDDDSTATDKRQKLTSTSQIIPGSADDLNYTGPWPPKQSSLILPKDYSIGLTPKQIMLLVRQNMSYLPPPPPDGVMKLQSDFPGFLGSDR